MPGFSKFFLCVLSYSVLIYAYRSIAYHARIAWACYFMVVENHSEKQEKAETYLRQYPQRPNILECQVSSFWNYIEVHPKHFVNIIYVCLHMYKYIHIYAVFSIFINNVFEYLWSHVKFFCLHNYFRDRILSNCLLIIRNVRL